MRRHQAHAMPIHSRRPQGANPIGHWTRDANRTTRHVSTCHCRYAIGVQWPPPRAGGSSQQCRAPAAPRIGERVRARVAPRAQGTACSSTNSGRLCGTDPELLRLFVPKPNSPRLRSDMCPYELGLRIMFPSATARQSDRQKKGTSLPITTSNEQRQAAGLEDKMPCRVCSRIAT